jgi:hypothetical protein
MVRKLTALSCFVSVALFATREVAAQAQFIRGDSNHDQSINISDPVDTLNFLFAGSEAPPCRDAADANDDNQINIADAVYSLNFQFLGGDPPPPPYPNFEADPTDDTITCLGPPVVISGEITEADPPERKNWTRDKVYELQGEVYVRAPVVLTIEEGVTVLATDRAVLVIDRGARIEAIGTETHPVVFTSAKKVGERAKGNWGGLILLGRGDINIPGKDGLVEGLTDVHYGGGATPDVNDSSGRLSYVRVEYGGFAISVDNEVNSITLAACGAGTQLDHIQCKFNDDDGVEWFGGSASLRYGLVSYVSDDMFDYSFGWSGNGQFWVGHQTGVAADTGFEVDNSEAAGSFGNTPITRPHVSNVTMIGTGDPASPKGGVGMLIRRGAGSHIENAIVQGFKGVGLDIDDQITCEQNYSATDSESHVFVRHAVFYANGAGGTNHFPAPGSETGAQDEATWDAPPGDTPPPCANLSSVLVGHATNIIATASPTVDPHNLTAPNFRPQNDAVTAPTFDPTAWDSFFVPVNYRGGVPPDTGASGEPDWTQKGWISYAQN